MLRRLLNRSVGAPGTAAVLMTRHALLLKSTSPVQSAMAATADAAKAGVANSAATSSGQASTAPAPAGGAHATLFPARQSSFARSLHQEEEKTLLAKSPYCLFSLSYDQALEEYGLYAATTNETVIMKQDHLWKASMWLDERVSEDFIAGLIFPCDNSAVLKEAAALIAEKTRKRVVVSPDTWGITYLAFRAQQEVVKGMELPLSLEHAAYALTNTPFSTASVDSTVFNMSDGSYLPTDAVADNAAARAAMLAWSVLFSVHKRFGTPGSRKTLNPIDQIVRRAVKAVNVFVVDINVRVGKGSIREGHTMIVTIYDAQKRNQTVHMIRSLAEETIKLNTLTTLLYGEGSSSISLFVPTMRTKSSQLVAFARTCRPKSPFFVAEIASLSAFFGGHSVGAGVNEELDPRATWCMMRANCFPDKRGARTEETQDRYLQRGFTALANKLFADRLHKVAPAIATAVGSIPPQEDALLSQKRVQGLVTELKKHPVPSVASAVFVNRVNTNDAEVVFTLQQWRAKIYEHPDRLAREKEAMESLRRYLIVDLETTTTRRYKRIANPFIGENFVVLSGARDYLGNVFMPTRYFDRNTAMRYDDVTVTSGNNQVVGASSNSLFLPPLDDYNVIVGHNIKFDLLQIWRDPELRKFLRRGGKIWDTMYAEYLLTGHEVKLGHGAGLEDVAKSYGGQTPKLDAVKRAWAEGKQTFDIPYRTLVEYLHGDLENTELIYRKQLDRSLQQRQTIICAARMEGVLCTTEMEYNGLKINVDLAVQQSNELMMKVAELRNHLEEAIPGEIPMDCRKFFNWASNQHLIKYFFGGQMKLSTNARESKLLPGETFARHTVFATPEDFPPDQYPRGVFLRPPTYTLGIGDCAIMAGFTGEKGTRMFKAYFDSYMRQANFRKSSTMLDSLRREVTEAPRSNLDHRGATGPMVNLLPLRHVFLFAAVVTTAQGAIQRLFVKNPITNDSVTITSGNKAEQLEAFIAEQIRKYTSVITPVDEDTGADNAFAGAEVTIFARDAGFTFRRTLQRSGEMASYLNRHSGYTASPDVKTRYTITLADTVPILAFYKHQYPAEETKKRTGGHASTAVVPAKLLPAGKAKTKAAAAHAFAKKLSQETAMKPEEWCNLYSDAFLHMANESLQREAFAVEKKRTKKGTKASDAAHNDEDMPVLLRHRRAFVGYYNSLPDAERKRLSLMCLCGRTVSSAYDCFAVPCNHDDVVVVDVKGRLATYIPSELEAEQVMRRFRSSTTRQLQVGEDTLNYFKNTHHDRTASTILELRGLEKLLGTYYESTDGGTGMVSLVHSTDSCIHHELIHNKTNTGRLASANPNCQNIPKEDKSNLRDMFISRFGDMGMCIEADYSQLEVVALAVLANDEQMLDDLRHSVDFHCKRVSMMRPDLKYTEVLLRAKKNKEPEFVKLRQQAKIFSFQRQYGAGVKMISQSTGLTMDQVRMLIEKESETYRGVDVFNAMVAVSANSYDPSIQDGARNVRGHQLFKGLFPTLTGSRYIFTESDIPEAMANNRQAQRKSTNFSPTHLKNYPVQGFAGEIVQVMLGILWRHFVATENYNGLAFLTNTVHDCVWVDCHQSVYRQVAKDVEAIMDSVRAVLNNLYPEMQVTVDFPCDVVAGENMGALRPIIEETSL